MDDDDIGLVEKEEMSERIEKYEDETKKTEKENEQKNEIPKFANR